MDENFGDELIQKKKNIEDSVFVQKNRTMDWTAKQMQNAQSMSDMLKQDAVLTTVHTEEMTDEQMEAAYKDKYYEKLNTKNAREGTREMKKLKKQSQTKAKNAMALHKQLQTLSDDGTDYKELVGNNFRLSRIADYKFKPNKNDPDNAAKERKVQALKKNAPLTYERGLRMYHSLQTLEKEKDKYPELYNFAYESYMQAQKEWEHIEKMVDETLIVPVKIDEEMQKKYLSEREALSPEEKRIELDFSKAGPDYYLDDYNKNMKKKKVDWDKDDGSDGVASSVKKVLRKEIEKIQKKFPDATPDSIEATVNEYLKRIAEKTQFRARVHMNAVPAILNSKYHSKFGNSNYANLIHMQYSKRTKWESHHAISFGSLGGDNAKEFIGYKSSQDPCAIYGNVSLKLDKEAMKGRISFVSGNSLDHYEEKYGRSAFVDEEHGVAPDITMCGTNLEAIYKRARELEKNHWKGMLSSEQEAAKAITDHGDYPYFEAHYHGTVGTAEIAEATYILNTKSINLTDKNDVRKLKDSDNLKDLYEHIKIINNNPEEYRRVGKPELKLTVWDLYGNQLSYEDVKAVFESDSY